MRSVTSRCLLVACCLSLLLLSVLVAASPALKADRAHLLRRSVRHHHSHAKPIVPASHSLGELSDPARVGPCPGLALSSCACFQRLHEQAQTIMAMEDAVARNWFITLAYQDISHSFQELLQLAPSGDLPGVGVWPGVAAWASRLVGFGIRGQALMETAAYDLNALPEWLQTLLLKFPELLDELFGAVVQRAAVGLGAGNLLVFNEIGSTYTNFGMRFCEVPLSKPDEGELQRFISEEVCTDPAEGDDCLLGQSVTHMWRAMFAQGANNTREYKEQHLLLQGMLSGLQEQTRLQAAINASLPGYAVPCWGLPSSFLSTHPELSSALSLDSDASVGAGMCIPPESINSMATQWMVHMLFGDVHLNTHEDFPTGLHNSTASPSSNVTVANFSPYLANLSVVAEAGELMGTMLGHSPFQPQPLNGTAAQDWNMLAQRMRFVAPLFWALQDHPSLNCFVFTAAQEAAIRANATQPLDQNTWTQICIKDCCTANGAWNGDL